MPKSENMKKRDEQIQRAFNACSYALKNTTDKTIGDMIALADKQDVQNALAIKTAIHTGIINAFADIAVEVVRAINNIEED